MPPIIVVTGRQRPHEVLLLVVSVLVGVAYLLGSPPAASVAALIPRWEIHVWAVVMLASGGVGLISIRRWGVPGLALSLELGAMLAGAGGLLVYVVAIFLAAGPSGLLAGGITAGWLCSNLWRAWQIHTELKDI
jgi:hypothetical protein